jgi:hypothetical protein
MPARHLDNAVVPHVERKILDEVVLGPGALA